MNEKEAPCNPDGGVVHISDDVVASIAALAAVEVEGVASLSVGVDLAEWLGRKNLAKGVKITMKEGVVFLEVSLMVRYSFPIPTVARQVQKKVKEAIESMTGLEVGEINIHVFGVSFDKDVKKKPSKGRS